MYEDRLVAYVDIIGWSSACCSEDRDELSCVREAARALAEVSEDNSENAHAALEEWATKNAGAQVNTMRREVRVSVFSDNYVVSMPSSFGLRIALDVAGIALRLLRLGFLTRGGIARGKMRHDAQGAFGPALIEAVKLEGEAHLPRILCSSEVVAFINAGPLHGTLPLVPDHLGRWVVNQYDARGWASNGRTLAMHREMWQVAELEALLARKREANAAYPSRQEKWDYASEALRAGLARIEAFGAGPSPG